MIFATLDRASFRVAQIRATHTSNERENTVLLSNKKGIAVLQFQGLEAYRRRFPNTR